MMTQNVLLFLYDDEDAKSFDECTIYAFFSDILLWDSRKISSFQSR